MSSTAVPEGPADTFSALPDPGEAGDLDELVDRLRLLKVWAGDPSYERIKDRINAAWTEAGRPAHELAGKTTVVDCFRRGRRRLNTDLVLAVVRALHSDVGYVAQWGQALRVVGGEVRAASQVRVQDTLPHELAQFTGRTAELEQIRQALRRGQRNGAAVTCAIEGMAGVGKTQLAIHAGRVLASEAPFDRVLFVNLRGFHPDPAQPPADPAAVLDGFLRLLDVPAGQIPYELAARSATYRDRLAGGRTLVILDNAADAEQVRPLLPEGPGCLALVTSRRDLTALRPAARLTLDVFTPGEAVEFLGRVVPAVPVGPDPDAAARVASRCGHLPLALRLLAAHMADAAGWTLTDHADRLDEHHRHRRVDTAIEVALDLSYQNLPGDQQRLLRLLALHPGPDISSHAAAALGDVDLGTAGTLLDHLHRDHLIQQVAPGRYGLHDLIRAYAGGLAGDHDPPPVRRAALTRLFDHYLATAAAAVNLRYPSRARYRPPVPDQATAAPTITDPEQAHAWLDAERPTLVAVTAHAATHGWPSHATGLSAVLFRYLIGGHPTDALVIHGHARDAARRSADVAAESRALTSLGTTHIQLGRHETAAAYLRHALHLYVRDGDKVGQARTLVNLPVVEIRLGRYQSAVDHLRQALVLDRESGDTNGEAAALINLGLVEVRLGQYEPGAEHLRGALALFRGTDDPIGEAAALALLGDLEARLGRYGVAAARLEDALRLQRQLGHRDGEGWTRDLQGCLETRRNRPAEAAELHRLALDIFGEIGERDGEAWALNGLGEAASAAGRAGDAAAHHRAAHAVAADIGDRYQHARAHAGQGRAHWALAETARAREHYERALTLYTDLGTPEADEVRSALRPLMELPVANR
jgi:tetratricopeptide (TPR) repeat protein